MNDTPRTTTVTPKQRQMLSDLVWDHNNNEHKGRPRPGCAGCLLSGALDQDGGEG